jgi:hypothetical protein
LHSRGWGGLGRFPGFTKEFILYEYCAANKQIEFCLPQLRFPPPA